MRVNAVFEGGGVKAIGLVGGVKAAEEFGLEFEGLAGTSSGAIVASLIAAGYTGEEMKRLIMETPFQEFLKKGILHRLHFIGTTIRILVKKGLYSGDTIEEWIRDKLRARGVRTFSDLPQGKLRIIASDISEGRLLVLPDDISEYGMDPNSLEIAKAVRMSTSIPYFFDPVKLKNKKNPFYPIYIVDGAILSNFPMWLFDQSYQSDNINKKMLPTIGFQLVGKNENKPKKITGPFTMFQALFSTMVEAHDERYIEKKNLFRTIKIPTVGVRTTQFDIATEDSVKLYHSGEDAANHFLESWSYVNYITQFNEFCIKQ